MTTKREMVETFAPGDRVTVTNHWITRPDHPCYGTRTDTVARVNAGAITFEQGGRVPWPPAARLEQPEPGRVVIIGHPQRADLHPGPFLDIRKETPQ